ncbi:unnamed protein product [Dovyalis caffra]|uniref:Secreted protein n=1 Tax=Dovyalis caffra TaxID=77055 RepID=A0AAV1R5Q1_9ROSI|nr:unnamed protein product [Dovyalis caffra]
MKGSWISKVLLSLLASVVSIRDSCIVKRVFLKDLCEERNGREKEEVVVVGVLAEQQAGFVRQAGIVENSFEMLVERRQQDQCGSASKILK